MELLPSLELDSGAWGKIVRINLQKPHLQLAKKHFLKVDESALIESCFTLFIFDKLN
jgi:hypothetical protein